MQKKTEDLKKQEILIMPGGVEGLGRNIRTHTPCFLKCLSLVAFCSAKEHISGNLPNAWHVTDAL